MARAAKKSAKVEQDGVRVRLFKNGATWWADVRVGGERKRMSLRTTEKSTAASNAQAFASELAKQQLIGVTASTLTLGQLFDWFRQASVSKLNKKGAPVSKGWRTAAETRMQLFERAWKRSAVVADLGQSNIDAYVTARRSGALSSLADADAEAGRKAVTVRLGTTDSDLRFLKACFAYAAKRTVNGKAFLASNPLDRVSWPRENERNKLRPRASAERYNKTQEHSDTVDPTGRLRCAVALARHTGHREAAILKLRVSDILLTTEAIARALRSVGRDEEDAQHMKHGAILWRAENDKMGAGHVSALNPPVRQELDRYLAIARRIGDAWLFPGVKDESAHLDRRYASRLLVKAEVLAGLEKLVGGVWHPYRRQWATDRKGLSDVDVAAAGGWSDTRALKLSYQQSDAATMYSVVSHGT